jgi:hypothetical protein
VKMNRFAPVGLRTTEVIFRPPDTRLARVKLNATFPKNQDTSP